VDDERSGGFLPPRPAGPEPELGGAPTRRQPATGQPPPGYGSQGQPQAPPPPHGWQAPPWGYAPAVREPDNGPAIAGFVLSLVSGGLLLFSAGLSTLISVGCAVAGLIYSRKGKRKVEAGETSKNSGLAQAGFIISIVSLVLSILATAFWVVILVLALVDEDVQRELDDSPSVRASLWVTGAAVRMAAQLFG
jgi:hypothetical protein